MPLLEGIRGLFPGRAGRSGPGAAGISELGNAALVQEAAGRYAESVWNGEIYTLPSGLVATPAAGPLGAGGTPLLALWNPATSGFAAFIRRVGAFWTLGGSTAGKGFGLDVGPTAPITQVTFISGLKNDCSGGQDTDLRGFSAVALTGSSALSRLRPLSGVGGTGTAATPFQSGPGEEIGDAIILMPGTLLAITALLLGTANEAIAFIEYAKRKIT